MGLAGLGLCLAVASAQQGMILQKFKFTPNAFYPPPNQKQPKSLLTGDKAEEKTNGLYLITGGKFETFLETGTREMLFEAPSCIYEKGKDQSIHSPGPLRVMASEDKFSISGEHQVRAAFP